MKKALFFIILPALFIQLSTFTALPSVAQASGPLDLNEQEGFQDNAIPDALGQTGKPADPRTIISNVIKIVLSLLGIIFVVLLIYAGFQWMTAQGDEGKVTTAKETIVRAVIGLVIILSAWGVTLYVTKSAINATNKTMTL